LAALKIFDESRLCIEVGATSARDAGYEQVFLVRNAVLLIVDHFTVSIEREPEFDVAPDAKNCDRLALRCDDRELFSQWAGGVGAVEEVNGALGCAHGRNAEEWANAVKKED
jgi:hypothetical protein